MLTHASQVTELRLHQQSLSV